MNHFVELAGIDCSDAIEKKNGLSYLSWAWAVDKLLRADPTANWTYGEPRQFGATMMVYCTVTAFGIARTCQLPVMDHRNKAIADPDAFAVNTAMQRCLVKAIALHGLGLYIYAGEDIPPSDTGARRDAESEAREARKIEVMGKLTACATLDDMRAVYKAMTPADRALLTQPDLDACKRTVEAKS